MVLLLKHQTRDACAQAKRWREEAESRKYEIVKLEMLLAEKERGRGFFRCVDSGACYNRRRV